MIVTDITDAEMSRFNNLTRIELVEQTGQTSDIRFGNKDWETYFLKEGDKISNILFGFAPNSFSDITWQQQDQVKESLPEYFAKNFNGLEKAFNQELKKYSDYLIHDEKYSRKIFERIAFLISELPFLDGTIELTKKKGFKFTLLFPHNTILMVSKSLSSEDLQNLNDEVIYSLFINRQLIDFDEINLAEYKEELRELFTV